MADEDLLEPMDEADVGDGEEEEGGGSPLMRYLPIIAIVLVVQIVIAFLIAQWWMGSDEVPPEEEMVEAPVEEVAPEGGELLGGEIQATYIYEKLEPIVINPAGTDGLRFLSATIHLGLSDQLVEAAIDGGRLASKIRDRMIDILRNRTIEQLEPAYHDEIKEEIKKQLNAILPTALEGSAPAVVDIYFQGFVLQ